MYQIKIKRIYEPYESRDGFRILVDRLWPRGMNKEKAHIDVWLKEIAPSTSLRKWFNHEPRKWENFVEKYHDELSKSEAVDELEKLTRQHKKVALLYAATNIGNNHAVVLEAFLQKILKK